MRRTGQLDNGVWHTCGTTDSHRFKGANRLISGLRCRWHRLFSCIGFGKPRNPHPEKVKFCSGHHTFAGSWCQPPAAWLVVTQHGQEVHQEGRPWRQPPQCRPQAAALGKPGRPRSGGRSQGEACRRGCCRCSQGERAELAAQVLQVAAAKQRAAANQQVADKQRAAAFCEVDSQQWFFESQQVNRPHETEADLPAKHARFAGECSRLICAMFDAWYTLV